MSILADVSLLQLSLVAVTAICASVVGGVAGYGTGALMPLVLVPIIGATPVVPVIALSSIFSNASRSVAYRSSIDRRRTLIVAICALPTCMLGAFGYTLLNGRGALIVIGTMMVLSVPLRRLARRHGLRLSDRALAAASTGWGVIVGGTSGAGVILLSLLMASGLEGAAVIATDAAISISLGVTKIGVFGTAGLYDASVIAIALLIGVATLPGAFVAKMVVDRLPLHIHAATLDAVVLIGGALMIWNAIPG